jgi:hypothetical protein
MKVWDVKLGYLVSGQTHGGCPGRLCHAAMIQVARKINFRSISTPVFCFSYSDKEETMSLLACSRACAGRCRQSKAGVGTPNL